MPASCDSSSVYVASLGECVPNTLASDPVFLSTLTSPKKCAGGVIASVQALESLRFCSVITSDLIISVNDSAADFTALFDISSINGSWRLLVIVFLSHFADINSGALVVQNSSMKSLASFANLVNIDTLGLGHVVGGSRYSLVVTGLISVAAVD